MEITSEYDAYVGRGHVILLPKKPERDQKAYWLPPEGVVMVLLLGMVYSPQDGLPPSQHAAQQRPVTILEFSNPGQQGRFELGQNGVLRLRSSTLPLVYWRERWETLQESFPDIYDRLMVMTS